MTFWSCVLDCHRIDNLLEQSALLYGDSIILVLDGRLNKKVSKSHWTRGHLTKKYLNLDVEWFSSSRSDNNKTIRAPGLSVLWGLQFDQIQTGNMSVPTPPLHTLYPTAEQNRFSIYETLPCSKLAGMVASNYTEDRNLIIFTDG